MILGLDIGGTKTAVVVGNRGGRILRRSEFPTRPTRGFAPVFAELGEHVDRLREQTAAAGEHLDAISVSIGGPLEIERGIIHGPPNLPGWVDIPLKALLAERTGLPVHVEHDGNAGALAEWYFGAARGARNVIFLTMGTGLGAGLILNGQLYRGTCDLAGEVGHVRIAETGPAAYGKAGSWEGFCGGAGIARLAAERFPKRWRAEEGATREVVELAVTGDADALAVVQEVGRWLGRGLAVLLDVLNPEVVVIGSLAVRLGELVLAPARAELAREALPAAVAACRIVPAALGERLGDVAALCAAIRAGEPNPS
jgi:glucokinase